jgi:hypothetical protein
MSHIITLKAKAFVDKEKYLPWKNIQENEQKK